jgi:histidinol-phosphatase (PHP family)
MTASGQGRPDPSPSLAGMPDPMTPPVLDPALEGRDLPLDAHLHTDLSPDADVPIDLYAQLAVERGIRELAITDHVDFEPDDPAYAPSFEARERVVRGAAERWADRLAIHFGVEITYASARETEIRDHLSRHRYDYTIGSVHVTAASPYAPSRVATSIAGRSLADIVAPYFDEVVAAARSGLFDTIGHLDYVKRYLHPHVLPAELAGAPELYEAPLHALIDHGVTLEVNTSGLRQPPGEPYPPPWVVRRYRELGGLAVVAGSDAHRAPSFAYGLEAAYRAAAEAGVEQLAFRRGPERVSIPIPDRFRA